MLCPTETTSTDNRLLSALPAEELDRLRPGLETIRLATGQDLHAPGEPISHIYFPHRGVVSLVSEVPDSRSVEIATVGNEGMVGVAILLGATTMPSRAFCQIPGAASRMAAGTFRTALDVNPVFRALLLRYVLALLNQVAQTAVCNRVHPIEQRCARWLLMTHDQVNRAPRFPLTQSFLSQMLGVRRASVSVAASTLQREGILRYARGIVTIPDRDALEAAACPCYGIIRAEFVRRAPRPRACAGPSAATPPRRGGRAQDRPR
ncbi:Crp/Fnr family transcriptional regulator [Siccirubricoccus deserti]|uniref:Crp/Fnr family transcriptional regulator n=1 Tax=Siccirubricoccus deserti TaxID=2013562 RepID=A0A9X0UFL8_9PROT|nr:Crp/Fnr family transcriptional regulator [Siccirubricoccus deserti]MBC4018912.1 Crp/Fnr family transcriptional regulator [Siccirubricoccus deserti]GGC69530.1 Crp/Fnr family transcriptional regulator [Siccirubricoccus deserti]